MKRKDIPTQVRYYLDETEQEPEHMTDEEILEEAKWVLYLLTERDEFGTRTRYAPTNSIAAVERFIERLER